jgi:hypothetical protein
MTIVSIVFVPVVLGYQAWSLWTFRKRLGAPAQSSVPASRTRADPGAVAAPGESSPVPE